MIKVLYCILLFFCAAGWFLVIHEKPGSMENRGTLWGVMKMTILRIWHQLPEREWLIKQFQEKKNRFSQPALELELYKSSILLKNLILAEKESPFAADYLMEKLMEHSFRLKPVYGQMLALYRSGRDGEAFAALEQFCGTRSSRNFSLVLSKLDSIAPDELAEQIGVFQEIMEQQRMTDAMKLVQRDSMIITALAAAAMFVMMIDFTVVIVFMHTVTLMESVF